MATTKGTTKTTKKSTATKAKTTAKKKAEPVVEQAVEAVVEEKVKEEPIQKKKDEPKKAEVRFESDDLIRCRSVRPGQLIYQSKKSGVLYIWSSYDDEVEMLYSDLRTLYISKSRFIMEPWFIIENDALLEQWTSVRELYKRVYKYEDIDEVLTYSNDDFRNALLAMPEGLRESLKTIIATKIDEGSFDSLQKIKIADQILGTDLRCLLD